MSRTSTGSQFKVVIVGGGVAGLEAALTLRDLVPELVQTTILAPESGFVYRPMSVGEPFAEPAAARYQLSDLVAVAGATHAAGTLRRLASDRRVVHTDHGDQISYDAVLLAVGARRHVRFPHAITLDPANIDNQLHGIIQDVEIEAVRSLAFLVPPGRHWPMPVYELALMTAHRAYDMGVEPRITIVTPEQAPLAIFGDAASTAVTQLLQESGISVITDAHAEVPAPGRIRVRGQSQELHADSLIALPELRGQSIPGLPPTGPDGFIVTGAGGQMLELDRVFAAGDITAYPVKQGSVAAQQAVSAAHSLAALAGGTAAAGPFTPVLYGLLLGTRRPLYMRARLVDGQPVSSEVSESPPWAAHEKIHAPHLTRALSTCTPTAGSRQLQEERG